MNVANTSSLSGVGQLGSLIKKPKQTSVPITPIPRKIFFCIACIYRSTPGLIIGGEPLVMRSVLFYSYSTMNTVEAAIFDVGGVLHVSNTAWKDDVISKLALDPEVVAKIWAQQLPALNSGQIDEIEFWAQLRKEHGVRKVGTEENLLGTAFAETFEPHHEVVDLVRRLGESGIKLAILSNTIEPHARALRAAGLYTGYDVVCLSYETGFAKPGEAAYQQVLDELGSDPTKTVYTDDLAENIPPATSLGMQGHLFTTPQELTVHFEALLPMLKIA